MIYNKLPMGGGNSTRSFGLDLVRACAVLFVMSGHFFSLNTPFKEAPFDSASMFIQSIGFYIFKGVPLYLMLSGFLNYRKEVSKKYYKGAKRILISYLFFSIITILFRTYYLEDHKNISEWINLTLSFSAIPYAWYIEMWIGLFLIIPFLNIIYHHLIDKRAKHILILSFALITFLPNLTNHYGIHPVPDYWKNVYPITFYFIGMYIREYRPHVNKLYGSLLILAIGSINGIATLIVRPGGNLFQPAAGSEGLLGAIVGITFFLLFYDIDVKSEKFKAGFYRISKLSLDMYMCNFMADKLVYPYFIEHYYKTQSQFGAYFFIIVPILFVLAMCGATIKEFIFSLFSHIIARRPQTS